MHIKELTDAIMAYRSSIAMHNKVIKTKVKNVYKIGGGVVAYTLYADYIFNNVRGHRDVYVVDPDMLRFFIYIIRMKIQAFYVTKN